MNVFISWSGEPSRRVAEALRDWLPQVIQAVQPWMSAADVDKGARWAAQVAGQLAETKVGILCLAPDNLTAPWLLFEAGALSKTLENTHVCPYLLGVEVPAIQGPLAQFQATRANQDDTLRLVKTINGALGESALKEGQVNAAFAKWWPELEQRLTQAAAAVAQPVAPARTERSMIEEILDVVRTLARDASERDRWDKLNVALSKALGAIDTSTTTPALARLTTSPMEQAFFEVERRARLEAVAQSLLNFKPSPSTTATPEAEPLRGLLDVKPSPSTTAQPKISPAPTKPQKK